MHTILRLKMNTANVSKTPKIFPKLFIADAYRSFKKYLVRHHINYDIHSIANSEELSELIAEYSHYKNYTLPVIIEDISFLNKKTQSQLLKFMEDTSLNLILLASRDNILDTIISRVKEFRKFYISTKDINFLALNKAHELMNDELREKDSEQESLSYDDKLLMCIKYNPILAYTSSIVHKYRKNEQDKLITLLEF